MTNASREMRTLTTAESPSRARLRFAAFAENLRAKVTRDPLTEARHIVSEVKLRVALLPPFDPKQSLEDEEYEFRRPPTAAEKIHKRFMQVFDIYQQLLKANPSAELNLEFAQACRVNPTYHPYLISTLRESTQEAIRLTENSEAKEAIRAEAIEYFVSEASVASGRGKEAEDIGSKKKWKLFRAAHLFMFEAAKLAVVPEQKAGFVEETFWLELRATTDGLSIILSLENALNFVTDEAKLQKMKKAALKPILFDARRWGSSDEIVHGAMLLAGVLKYMDAPQFQFLDANGVMKLHIADMMDDGPIANFDQKQRALLRAIKIVEDMLDGKGDLDQMASEVVKLLQSG